MRYADGKLYASPRTARIWRPILQPIADAVGGFLEHRGITAALLTAALLLWGTGR